MNWLEARIHASHARQKASGSKSRCRNASHLLNSQLRLQTDNIRQPVREQMANLRMHRRNSTEHEAADRKQHSFENARDLEDFGAETVVLDHVFQQTGSAHFILSHADA